MTTPWEAERDARELDEQAATLATWQPGRADALLRGVFDVMATLGGLVIIAAVIFLLVAPASRWLAAWLVHHHIA